MSYLLEIDDKALVEHINTLDNAKEVLTNALKRVFSLNNAQPSHEEWMEEQVGLAEKEADSQDAQWFSMDDVFQEAYKRIHHAHTVL